MPEPIRVLQVVGRMRRGGMETLIMNIYRNIDRTKVQFDFLVHYSDAGEYDDEIRSLGGNIYCIPVMTDKRFFSYYYSLNKFFDTHTEYKIVHGHWTTTAIFYLGAAKAKKIPVRIAHSHNTRHERTLKGLVSDCLHKPIKYVATDFFSCSDAASSLFLTSKDIGRYGSTILNNGIEVAKFKFCKRIRDEVRHELKLETQFVVGHIGTFSQQKNHIFLIDVFCKVLQQEPNAVLLLVGGGGDEQKVRDKVKLTGIEDSVCFLGIRDDISRLLMAMDAFVFPSISEGLGIVLIEAQATGMHCFTSAKVVPAAAQVTELLEYIPLESGATAWATKILESRNVVRTDQTVQVKQAGYDIAETGKWLEEFYINEYTRG